MGDLVSDHRYKYLWCQDGKQPYENPLCDGIEKRVRLEVERMVLNLRQVLGENGPIIM